MNPSLFTTKALDPRSAIFSSTYLLKPSMRETTTMTVATPNMIPSRVRNDLNLCAAIVLKARRSASTNFILPSECRQESIACLGMPYWMNDNYLQLFQGFCDAGHQPPLQGPGFPGLPLPLPAA